MKFVLINGPSCSGKTATIKNILENTDNFFHLSYDTIKWSFSKYKSGKYTKEIMLLLGTILEAVCEKKFNIICDSGIHKEYRENLLNIARKNNYEIIMINLEADYDVLLKRFEARVEANRRNPQYRLANTSEERHREIFNTYHADKEVNAITFRTDKESPEEISQSVIKLIT